MPSLSAYTPLEVFLFFQSLASLDAKPSSFSPVSHLLKNNSFVREDVTFDPERLAPQALEELYTTLVKEGVEDTGSKAAGLGQNGHRSESPGSSLKKRKLPSPPRRGHDDAPTHSTVVPSLVSHLYAKYKDRVTRDIQNEEKRYKEIREEITRLENEDYGETVPSQTDGQPTRPETLEKPSHQAPVAPQDTTGVETSRVDKDGNRTGQLETGPGEGPVGAMDGKPVNADQNREPSLIEPQKAQEPPAVSGTPLPDNRSPEQASRPQQEKISPQAVHQPPTVPYMATGHPIQPPQSSPINGHIPFLPPPQQSGHGYRLTSPSASSPSHTVSPHSQQQTQPAQPPTGSMGVFGQGHTNPPPQSPVILPPPGANVPLGAPSPSRSSLGEAGSNHHRTPSATKQFPSPKQQIPPSLQHSFQPPWSPRESPHTPYPHVSPYANAPYSNSHHVSGRPFPANSTPYGHLEHPRPYQNPYAQPGQMAPGGTPGFGQSPHPSVEGAPFSSADRAHLHKNTPSQTPSFSSRRPPRLPSLDTTGSQTPWKKTPLRIDTSKSPGSPAQPRPEDVSPISERAPSPDFETARQEPEGQKPSQKRGGKVTKPGKKKTVPPLELRNVPSFDSGKTSPVRTRRGGSGISSPVATSSTRHRSRGHSIVSRGDESATDPGSATQRKIKHEIPSTPAEMEMSEDADAGSRPSTRRRTAASLREESSAPAGRMKRKRGLSEAEDSQQQQQSQPPPSTRTASQNVFCTRNFPRTSAPIMNDVTAHKHASIFAKPLTERDAPGYKDLIFRPQDLKSIKSAIHQGSRAVASATEAASTPAADGESPGTGAGTPSTSKNATLTLKKTAELVPPKGIINSPQLEKELMRMFANAVMFNPTPERSFGPSFPMRSDATSRESTQASEPDEGGIINDTKEMCEDVELAVTRWRAAERTADDI